MNRVGRIGQRLAKLPAGRYTKWVIVVGWLVAMVVLGPLAGKLTGAENNQNSSWLPSQAESTKVFAVTDKFVSQNDVGGIVIYERDSGLTAADRAKAASDVTAFGKLQYLSPSQIQGPFPSTDGKALETVVTVDMGTGGWSNLGPAVTNVRNQADQNADGLTVHVTGPAGYGADQANAFNGIDGTLLYATVGVIVILLLLTYRSPVLWLLPLTASGAALSAAEGVVYLLAKHAGLIVNAESAGILLVLVMGAGTDYALLLIARYREELRRHEDRHEAMAVALHRAGPAVIASASTVGIGMLCLLVAEMNSTSGLGPVCAVGVIVALLSMTTLLPALLVIFGRWMFWPVRPTFGSERSVQAGLWGRIGTAISHRPRVVWSGTVVLLLGLAVGLIGFHANGLSTSGAFTNTPDSVVGQQVAAAHFPAGEGSPVIVVANDSAATAVHNAFAAVPGIQSVTAPVDEDGYVYLQGTLSAAADSTAADSTVTATRTAVHAVPGANALVGGTTAVLMDTASAESHDNEVVIPLILLVVMLVLSMLLRALIAPVVLIITVVLSYAAAMGISSLFFRHVFHFEGSDGGFPLLTFVFLVALGIDYNIFLMSRVREESVALRGQAGGTKRGALIGLASTGGVITSAGMILAGTFGVLGTLPVVSFAEIGFAVALGVLLDTFIVRSVLVTALTMDLGRRIWWPSALGRSGADEDESSGITPAEEAALL